MADESRPNRRILNAVKERVISQEVDRLQTTNYYIFETIFTPSESINIPRQPIQVNIPTIVAFADDAPLYNWGHPCRYLLHDAENGELYEEVLAEFPPFDVEGNTPPWLKVFHEPLKFIGSKLFS